MRPETIKVGQVWETEFKELCVIIDINYFEDYPFEIRLFSGQTLWAEKIHLRKHYSIEKYPEHYL